MLALLGGLFLLKAKGGGGESSATTTAAPVDPATGAATAPTAPAAPVDPATADPAAAATAALTATGVAAPTTPAAPAGAVPANLIPGPGLPKGFLSAYRDGDAIALLVRRAGAIDDALVHDSVELLRSLPDVEVYVTKARHIARYAWLTQGVNVTEPPALVMLRPRRLSGGKATASVSYGFRNSASVLQAAKDTLYRGPTNRPYHP